MLKYNSRRAALEAHADKTGALRVN
jgi:hypothetical protein